MKSKDDIKVLLDYFQSTTATPLQFDEAAIAAAYQQEDGKQSLAIKILSVFGGIMASLAFLGFLLIAGLYKSDMAMIVSGIIFIAGSVLINKKYDKIIIDTVSVSAYIIGFILLGYGCANLKMHENAICTIFIILALASLVFVRNYILSFVSVLIICGSILTIILSNNAYNLIHGYVSALAMAATGMYLKEASIITAKNFLARIYNPARTGLILSFTTGLALLGIRGMLPLNTDYIWLSSIFIIALIVYLMSALFQTLNITTTQHKILIYTITLLTLLPTILSPAISGALLIMQLSFRVNHKTGLVLGIISFIYFISQYYYDLNFTLLTKSILLFSTGVLFIALYLFTHKKLTADEKV